MKRAASAPISALLITLMLVASSPSLKAVSEAAQVQWSKTYNGLYAIAIQTMDEGYALLGTNATFSSASRGYAGYTPLLIKTDSSGAVQWQKNAIGGPYEGDSFAYSIVQTGDSGYALCGNVHFSYGWLVKTDAEGNVKWNITLEGPLTEGGVTQTKDGDHVIAGDISNNIYVAAQTATYVNIITSDVLLKFDQHGNRLWNKTFSEGSSAVAVITLVEANDGGYAVAGTWNAHFWFAKTDSNGNLQWNQIYNVSNLGGVFNSIAKTKDGGYILAGAENDGQGGYLGRAWLLKTDAKGNMQWNHSYASGDTFYSVVQTTDGGYIAVGHYLSHVDATPLALLVRTDSSGNVQWNATYGYAESRLSSVTLTTDGGFAVSGKLNNTIWLAKFAPESAVSETPNLMVWIIAIAVVIVAVAGAGLLVYLRKRKH
jgi:hypothetical protein